MRNPIQSMMHNLAFSRTGAVWATFRVEPVPYGWRPEKKKHEVRALHTALLRAMVGELLLMSLCAEIDPASVVSSTLNGVNLSACPQLADEAEANLDRLERVSMGMRRFYLSVPLSLAGRAMFDQVLGAAWWDLKDMMGLPRSRPSESTVRSYLAKAEDVRSAIPRAFHAVPIGVQEHLWIFEHAATRGLFNERSCPGWGESETDFLHMSAMPAPVFDVAGQTDHEGAIARINVLKSSNRFLKVSTHAGDSYQTALTVAGTPAGGLVFPGGEWLGSIDKCGAIVDFAQRITTRTSKDVERKNLKAFRELNDQVDQREGDSGFFVQGGLTQQFSALEEYISLMNADELEVETESTTILTVSGETREAMEEGVQLLEQTMGKGGWGFKISREPAGAQEELYWSSLPGTPATALTRQLSQITTGRSLAAAVPITTSQLGDHSGFLIGIGGIDAGMPHPILMDLEKSATSLHVSPSFAVVGELGSGKSVLLKTVGLHMADRGSHIVAIDRSKMGEWVQALSSIEGLRTVEISEDAEVSLDPLRVMGAADAPQYAQNMLMALAGCSATSSEAGLLGEILEGSYRKTHNLHSLAAVVDHLASLTTDKEAKDLHRRLNSFARKPLTRCIFDPSLEPLSLEDPAIVFRTQKVVLPTTKELESAHRFANLTVEKVFGRAIYALLVAVARTVIFERGDRMDVLFCDEAHALTLSEESTHDLEFIVRDGRKHLAGLGLGSHDPSHDFGESETLRKLISWRFLMRHRDKDLAENALHWMGLKREDGSVDPDLVETVTQELSPIPEGADEPEDTRLGECIIRDCRTRVGMAKILTPASANRAQDVLSTPTVTEAIQ